MLAFFLHVQSLRNVKVTSDETYNRKSLFQFGRVDIKTTKSNKALRCFLANCCEYLIKYPAVGQSEGQGRKIYPKIRGRFKYIAQQSCFQFGFNKRLFAGGKPVREHVFVIVPTGW